MKYVANSGKLFEGMDEIIANVVLEGAVHILRLKSTEKNNLYEVVGNTAVKTDEPVLETQLLEGITVRLDLEQAQKLIERYKEEAKKAWDRSEMYKQKYEDSEYEKDCMREEYEEEIRAKDKEITILRAKLEYADDHPQRQTIVYGNLHNNQIDKRSQVAVKEIKVEPEGVGVQVGETKKEESGDEKTQLCKYIVVERAKDNTSYGLGCKPEDDQKRVEDTKRRP